MSQFGCDGPFNPSSSLDRAFFALCGAAWHPGEIHAWGSIPNPPCFPLFKKINIISFQTLFVLNLYASGMDSEVFPNAEKFLPERWFRDGNESSRRHPFACLPFGFGNRSCVGEFQQNYRSDDPVVSTLSRMAFLNWPTFKDFN